MRRFLALGDSYTMGEGVAGDAGWPVQLAARLGEHAVVVGDPQIVATTGWTTGELLAALDAAILTPPYAFVTLLIGVNDQYRGVPVAAYHAGFRRLLGHAIALGGGAPARVIVISIPDWGATPFARREGRDPARVARTIDAFNAVARGEAEAAGAHWVDVTAISRAPESCEELVADGLHPSAAQYARWVDAILPMARVLLGSCDC